MTRQSKCSMIACTAFAAVFALMLTVGCSQQKGSVADCKQCPGTCNTPCPAQDGAKKCGSDCTKPCCAKSDASAAANTKCPISGKPANAAVTVAYSGKTVAFCCPGCINGWDKLSDADKNAKLASASSA